MSGKLTVQPEGLAAQIQDMTRIRNEIRESMDRINAEYDLLGDYMQGEAATARVEFQRTADILLQKTGESIQQLEQVSHQFGENTVGIDQSIGRSVAGA